MFSFGHVQLGGAFRHSSGECHGGSWKNLSKTSGAESRLDKFGIHEPTTVFGVMGKVNMSKGVNVARKEDQGASPEHSTSRESVGSWEMDGVDKCCW